ncbi:hypothetical protein HDU67_002275, partial [Dinochytrium kinnereticum]
MATLTSPKVDGIAIPAGDGLQDVKEFLWNQMRLLGTAFFFSAPPLVLVLALSYLLDVVEASGVGMDPAIVAGLVGLLLSELMVTLAMGIQVIQHSSELAPKEPGGEPKPRNVIKEAIETLLMTTATVVLVVIGYFGVSVSVQVARLYADSTLANHLNGEASVDIERLSETFYMPFFALFSIPIKLFRLIQATRSPSYIFWPVLFAFQFVDKVLPRYLTCRNINAKAAKVEADSRDIEMGCELEEEDHENDLPLPLTSWATGKNGMGSGDGDTKTLALVTTNADDTDVERNGKTDEAKFTSGKLSVLSFGSLPNVDDPAYLSAPGFQFPDRSPTSKTLRTGPGLSRHSTQQSKHYSEHQPSEQLHRFRSKVSNLGNDSDDTFQNPPSRSLGDASFAQLRLVSGNITARVVNKIIEAGNLVSPLLPHELVRRDHCVAEYASLIISLGLVVIAPADFLAFPLERKAATEAFYRINGVNAGDLRMSDGRSVVGIEGLAAALGGRQWAAAVVVTAVSMLYSGLLERGILNWERSRGGCLS